MQKKLTLTFSQNWNAKLFCHCYSTIRLRNDERYKVGNEFDVIREGEVKHSVKVVSAVPFKLEKLTASMSYLDMGCDLETGKRTLTEIYKNKDLKVEELHYVILAKTEPLYTD